VARTVESEVIRKEFLAQLKDYCEANGYVFTKLQPRRELYLIVKKGRLYIVFVKVSVPGQKWWGVTERLLVEIKEFFDDIKKPGQEAEKFIILLETAKRGYLLKGDVFDELRSSLKLVGRQYHIHKDKLDASALTAKCCFFKLDVLFDRLKL